MPGSNHGPSIKNPRVYDALRRKGMDKAKAAAISNALVKGGYGSTYLALAMGMPLAKEKQRDYTRSDDGKFSETAGSGAKKPAPKPKAEKKPTGAEAQAANRAAVGEVLLANDDERLSPTGLESLNGLANGKGLTPEAEAHLVKVGLVKLDADGVASLTPEGRAVVTAANKGDADAVGAALDNAGKRTSAAAARQADADAKVKEKADADAKAKADAEAKAKEDEKKKKGGGGGGGGKGNEKKTEATPEEQAAQLTAAARETGTKAGLKPATVDALRDAADGKAPSGKLGEALVAAGLADADGLTPAGRKVVQALEKGDARAVVATIGDAQRSARAAGEKARAKAEADAARQAKDDERRALDEARTAREREMLAPWLSRKAARLPYGVGAYALAKHLAGKHNQKTHGKGGGGESSVAAPAKPAKPKKPKKAPKGAGGLTSRQRAAAESELRYIEEAPHRANNPMYAARRAELRTKMGMDAPTIGRQQTQAERDAIDAKTRRALSAQKALLGKSDRLAKRATATTTTYSAITKRDDAERLVFGVASTGIIDDQPGVWEGRRYEGDVVEPAAMREALSTYWGNIRAMHDGKVEPVGRALDVLTGDDGNTYLVAKVVDDAAWADVVAKVYRGFSIGGRVLKARLEKVGGRLVRRITKLLLTEISLVDRPANPQAAILVFKRHPQGGDMAESDNALEATEEGDPIALLGDLAGDDLIAKAADPKKVVGMIQELRNAAELEGDLEAAERYTQAIGLMLIASGDADAGDIDEDIAEEEDEVGADLDTIAAQSDEGEAADAMKVLKAGRKIAAQRMALLKSALMTYAKALADAGDEDAAKMLKALDAGDPADSEAMKALISDELKKALSPADSGLQTVAKAVLSLFEEVKKVASDVKTIAAQPVAGGPAQRLAPALVQKRITPEPAEITKRAEPDDRTQKAIYRLEQLLITETNPRTRAQYEADLKKLTGGA